MFIQRILCFTNMSIITIFISVCRMLQLNSRFACLHAANFYLKSGTTTKLKKQNQTNNFCFFSLLFSHSSLINRVIGKL